MLMDHPIFHTYFPGESYQPISIPKSIASELENMTLEQMPMKKFKNGSFPDRLIIEFSSPVRTLSTEPSEDAMFAFVLHKNKTLLCFQSYLLTNFRFIFTNLNKVPTFCPEMVFKLGCLDVHKGDANYLAVMRAIFNATEPKFAKFATDGINKFNKILWHAESKGAMFRAILSSTMIKEGFDIFQKCLAFTDAQCGNLDGFPPIHVMETTTDMIWGTGVPCMQALDRIKAQVASTPDADLFDIAKSLFPGKNQLGEIIVDVMLLVHGKTFEEYLAFVRADFEFFRVVE
jgi:predicted NAD-dependent protein-ADP-ribosyltransferase YbiA (DUF1768 family)